LSDQLDQLMTGVVLL